MAKIGKFSSGLKGSVKTAGSPYGQSNKGWDARSSMMGSFGGKNEVTMSKGGTATGKEVPVYKGDKV